jgi:Tfp pilus assembly protein PilF
MAEQIKNKVIFNQAIALDPEYGAAYYSRSSLFAKMGDNDRAHEDAQTFAVLTEMNVAEYANDNYIWRSHHLTLEDEGMTDPKHR